MAQNQRLRTTLTETQADVAAIKNDLAGIRAAVIQHSRILKAVISLLGDDSLRQEVERQDAEEQAAGEAQQAEGVKAMTEQGILKVVEAIGEKSFVVGTDTFAPVEGQPTRRPQRVQFEFAQVKAEAKSLYLGKKVGDTVEAPGGVFTINEVYDIDVIKAVENAQKAAAAQSAPPPGNDGAVTTPPTDAAPTA